MLGIRNETSTILIDSDKGEIANRLTKALPKQRFQSFVNMIGMVDIKE